MATLELSQIEMSPEKNYITIKDLGDEKEKTKDAISQANFLLNSMSVGPSDIDFANGIEREINNVE